MYTGCIAFVLGIFARSLYDYTLPQVVFIFLLSFALALVWQRGAVSASSTKIFFASIFFLCFAIGSVRMEIATWDEHNQAFDAHLDTPVSLEGEVIREVEMRTSTQHIYVRVADEVVLVTTDKNTEVTYGDIVTVEGALALPEAFETDMGRVFDYKGYLQARGVEYMISFATVGVLEEGQGNFIISSLLSLKKVFISSIEKVIPQPAVGLAQGLLLGVKQSLGEEFETAFRKTGIMHIVVLSGYNIMIVVTFVMYVFALLLPLRGRILFGVIAIVLFACLVGLGATVIRASAMAVLALIAKATGRTYAVVRALVLTGVVMLLLNPYLLVYDVGFQLSFIATLGLILVAPHLEKYLGFMPTTIGLREFLTATVATQIFVTPILLYHIGEFSVVAVAVNLLVLPMVPVAMLLTFLTGLVGFLSTTLALPFGYISYLSLSYILFVAKLFAQIPYASFVVPSFPFIFVCITYLLYALILTHMYRKDVRRSDTLSSWTIVEEEIFKSNIQQLQNNTQTIARVISR